MKIENILQAIGNTPIVKLNRIGKELACNIYAKCEFLNPGGSVKDRIIFNMIKNAEKAGKIKPGYTLIEATSGNTGIAISMAGAVLGYKIIITMPEKMSHEKQAIMEALGAKIYRTPTEAAFDSPESHISLARKLQAETPNSYILDQYNNPANPLIHYTTTAQEILDDLDNNLAMLVVAVGTGGTITGIARKLKELSPATKIIGVDPEGSILGGGHDVKPYLVEGIGYDFIPGILENNLIDKYIKTRDKESFQMARRLIREEGLLVGGSAGAAVHATLQAAKNLQAGENCVVILPDGARNYFSGFIGDPWMKEHNFL